jgi:hypothetical protein
MLRIAGVAAILVAALSACAASGQMPASPIGPASAPDVRVVVGALHVVPFAIAFRSGKRSPAAPVRVWQRGFAGRYAVSNQCPGVSVTLERYVDRYASLWLVRPIASVKQHCLIGFTGSDRHRGTSMLEIRVER